MLCNSPHASVYLGCCIACLKGRRDFRLGKARGAKVRGPLYWIAAGSSYFWGEKSYSAVARVAADGPEEQWWWSNLFWPAPARCSQRRTSDGLYCHLLPPQLLGHQAVQCTDFVHVKQSFLWYMLTCTMQVPFLVHVPMVHVPFLVHTHRKEINYLSRCPSPATASAVHYRQTSQLPADSMYRGVGSNVQPGCLCWRIGILQRGRVTACSASWC